MTGLVGLNPSDHLDVQPGATILLVGAAASAITSVAGGVTGRRRARGLAAH